MIISSTGLKDAFTIDPVQHGDERGFFFEGFSRPRLAEATGYEFDVFQSNHSAPLSFGVCITRSKMSKRS